MPIMCEKSKIKLLSADNIKKIYCEKSAIYSSGNTVTYMVDGSIFHQQEYEEGQSVLSPSITVPGKSGYIFAGWSTSASGDVLSNLTMGDNPITLYAIYAQASVVSFGFNGNIQSYTIPVTGIYELKTWGAQGGRSGGKGGYSYGKAKLKKGDVLYIAVGGTGSYGVGNPKSHVTAPGGFNGGGTGNANISNPSKSRSDGFAGGGGATHIAKNVNRGVLSNYRYYSGEVLIVAGGGGGTVGRGLHDEGYYYPGGTGGGVNGGSNGYIYDDEPYVGGASGGTQTNAGASFNNTATFGRGGDGDYGGSGGGGGWYGGGSGERSTGGGGSGYVGGVTEGSTQNGANTGNGSASVRFISSAV